MGSALLADAGVPMIFVQWPLMICALIPVIGIEALVMRRRLGLPNTRAFAGATKANLVSTLVGVPLAWGVMLAVEVITLYPLSCAAEQWHWRGEAPVFYLLFVLGMAWIGPPSTSAWPIALAAALLLIPTFFVSFRLERPFYRRSYPELSRTVVDRSVWTANLWSYGLLFVVGCGWIGWEVFKGEEKAPPVTRLIQEHPIDLKNLHYVAIPSSPVDSRPQFAEAVAKLEACLTDFQTLIHDVESGKIAVTKNLSTGRWQSFVDKDDGWTSIDYYDRLGPVRSVQKHSKNGSAIYQLTFNEKGFITRSELPIDGFDFDDNGFLRHWHGDKAEYWANATR
jgi:hypothetical protein